MADALYYQDLLERGYDPGYVEQLRSGSVPGFPGITTIEEMQQLHQGLLKQREEEQRSEEGFWDIVRAQRGGSPFGGVPPNPMREAEEPGGGLTLPEGWTVAPDGSWQPPPGPWWAPGAPPSPEGKVGGHVIPKPADETYKPPIQTPPPLPAPPAPDTPAEESWESMAERTAALQYEPEGYLERMGAEPGGVVGRAAVPGTGPAVTIHAGQRPASDISIARGEQDKRRSTYTPSLGAAEARARLRGQTGAFSPSRQLPPSDVSREFVAQTESPKILELWDERKRRELGLDYTEALSRQQVAKAIMLEEEAEELALDPMKRVEREMDKIAYVHRMIRQKLNPDIDAKVKQQMALAMQDPDFIEQVANNPEAKKALEASLRAKFEKESFDELMAIYSQMLMLMNPNAAALARLMGSQLQYGYGGGYGTAPGLVGTGTTPPGTTTGTR
ncbi:MAG: hypothetical protein GTO63_15640 [Anaerolineae bacterium]|nr:hypothetical protein [Anaerolineae bacterium]NIN96262.1 hypothetical protein [Anaerolineae bacterium]NIQ79282.1 hypothetical protein [Anaerolineae bacterium]